MCGLLALADGAAAQTAPPRVRLGTPAIDEAAPLEPREEKPPPPPVIKPVAAQGRVEGDAAEDVFNTLIQLAPPGPQRLFRLESEKELWERVRIERRAAKLGMDLPPSPEETPIHVLPPRQWSMLEMVVEPSYLCYHRTFFEQRNLERYGWDLGIIQPPIAAAVFYADFLALPIHWALDPCRWWECNSGLCLPGDPTPLLWYRMQNK